MLATRSGKEHIGGTWSSVSHRHRDTSVANLLPSADPTVGRLLCVALYTFQNPVAEHGVPDAEPNHQNCVPFLQHTSKKRPCDRWSGLC
jgi:hypothetical protein